MRHAVSNELHRYWRSLESAGRPPERSAIEPGAIRGILADTFVLDFDPAAGFPFRICGSRINALFLKELRGASFLQIWREADRGEVRAAVEAVADEEAAYRLLGGAHPPGLPAIPIEVALLPLRHDGATHARMLGSLALWGSSDWVGLVGCAPAAFEEALPMEPAAPGVRRPPPPAPTSWLRARFGEARRP